MRRIEHLLKGERMAIIRNSSYLVATTVATAVLGFAYWWVAARRFPAQQVGLAAAAVSAMTLLGYVAMLGFGTLLIREVHARGDRALAYVATGVLVSGAAGGALGVAALLVAPAFSPELAGFARHPSAIWLLPLGVALTASTLVVDQALIGMLRGATQFLRNLLFAATKLALIVALGLSAVPSASPSTLIFATWVAGTAASAALVAGLALRAERRLAAYRPDVEILRNLGRGILKHHALNLAVQAPNLALPVVVASTLSATAAGYFYAAWMMAGFVAVATPALGITLFAVGSRSPAGLGDSMRLTLVLSVLLAAGGTLAVVVVGHPLLSTFGAGYAAAASGPLVVLTLATLPGIVKTHFIQVARLADRIGVAAAITAAGAALELGCAALGAQADGLMGVSLGFLAAVSVEALLMSPPVLRAARPARILSAAGRVEEDLGPSTS